jgi:hypothetical protein
LKGLAGWAGCCRSHKSGKRWIPHRQRLARLALFELSVQLVNTIFLVAPNA